MKKTFLHFIAFAIITVVNATLVSAQTDDKHPYLNGSGHVVDSTGTKLGWITKDGTIYNASGDKVGAIDRQELVDYKGHKLGKIEKNGAFYDSDGKLVFTIEAGRKGEKCRVFDPDGKVIATVHESYKNQACAIHCLYKKMPS